uniref:Uncharacterized protein n=1 Tax=Neobodo designis TaxID=312471 RepID=A0A7S1MKI9_NEODS|mmetsp:Transcript_41054/g.126752  ORF Transcript_41054/g.126752 Transcript_41054/m.126752 type:complete len:696 (+) Transcript_41054:51-2138(+)|eukprot:CAMPEP_0174830218 /NCGR_PEP_ID=MMETSP1114-20130205/2401_1 /TAXON_ID=312471 /ORGANISM="Neobodo designis, Strain CCAP 1951/1" /LENGTH=695 /DNA_ID=CAMNT_0016064007 /DNA_START=50 /DNA_END=2137 /DNA_ORIENTATION=+
MAAEVCEVIWQLDDPTAAALGATAKSAAQHVGEATLIADTIEAVAHEAKEASNDGQLAAMWALVDRLCKAHEGFTEAFRPRIVALAEKFSVPRASPHFARFAAILEGFKAVFGLAVMSVISIKLRDVLSSSHGGDAPTTVPNADGIRQAAAEAEAARARQGALTTSLKSVGGFQMQRANNARPAGAQHALQVKTRDSLQAVRGGAMYAPAAPAEITHVLPERDADAAPGYMQALPANHQEQFKEARKKRYREMAQKWKEEEGRRRAQPGAGDGAASAAPKGSEVTRKIDTFDDVLMPAELPRDEFGIKIGNFPAGVRFLRDAIRACGGALELSVIEERISQMSDREAQAEFGNVRSFLHIHAPTFRVADEHNTWVVRVTDEAIAAVIANPPPTEKALDAAAAAQFVSVDDGDPTKPYTWEKTECPLCSYLCKGRNLAKHLNCRRCIDIQMARGLSGNAIGPIAALAFAARSLLDAAGTDAGFDDDDVAHFAHCVNEASNVARFKHASSRRFAPVLKALRVVRDEWLRGKGVEEMGDAHVTEDDGPYAALFAAFGANLRRLPVAWIDTGDVIDMAKRFCTKLHEPLPPIPRAGDPRIRVGNPFPGFMFAESDSDADDMPSTEEEEYSDDEGALYEFAPPVSIAETMMAAGIERETKRLNFRLRTAPPVPAVTAIKGDGTQSLGQVYKSQSASLQAR